MRRRDILAFLAGDNSGGPQCFADACHRSSTGGMRIASWLVARLSTPALRNSINGALELDHDFGHALGPALSGAAFVAASEFMSPLSSSKPLLAIADLRAYGGREEWGCRRPDGATAG